MPALRDYLELTARAAQEQWLSIEARQPVASGRQVDFVPVETLLCLAASLVVDHRRYGGSTSHKAAEPVPALAALFRRRNSSVLAKMANLDGSRPNGAKHELEVAARLLANPDQLVATYRLVLAAARRVGIDDQRLRDFLHMEHGPGALDLLGQEELPHSLVEAEVQAACERWLTKRPDLDERETERLLLAVTRIGQHRFAYQVLRNHGRRCVFCGLGVHAGGAPATRMLLASHIKPWRVCSASERLDPANGLTACPTHDVAFDTGLLTVNGGLRIHVKPELQALAERDPAARAAFGRPPLAERLQLPADAAPPKHKYLEWHQENVYRTALDP